MSAKDKAVNKQTNNHARLSGAHHEISSKFNSM
jgi:hypothetical protein